MLYSYFLNRNEFSLPDAPESASRDKQYAYSLYLDLLLMVLRLSGHRVADCQINFSNKFLTENRIGKALRSDTAVKATVFKRNSEASRYDAALESIYNQIVESAVYRSYTHRKTKDINDDIEFWKVVIATVFSKNKELFEAARKDELFTNNGFETAIGMIDETLQSCGGSRRLLIESRHALAGSLEKAYELYNRLLILPVALTELQDRRLDSARNKYLATSEDLNPNLRFIDNRLVKILADNQTLQDYCEDKKIFWNNDPDILMALLDKIVDSDLYKRYMSASQDSLEADTEFWRQAMKQIILPSDILADYLEEKSVYWNDDIDIIGTFVVKTLRRAQKNAEEATDADFVMPQFKDDEDERFGEELFSDTIDHFDEYREMIDQFINSSQWDPERLAFMDVIIMATAISELLNYPAIPIPVTLNEYIEIANYYSTPRSGQFINGILFSVINYLREEGRLLKK